MSWLIFAIVLIVLSSAITSVQSNRGSTYNDDLDELKDSNIDFDDNDLDDTAMLQCGQEKFIGCTTCSIRRRSGYELYPIKGMYYRSLSIYDVGRFEGYAQAETNNEYDKYAIAICREDATLIGYLPAKNKDLHKYIIANGGYVHCIGYVVSSLSGKSFHGEVIVESDKTLVKNRNRVYSTDEKYYIYEEGELKSFLDAIQL